MYSYVQKHIVSGISSDVRTSRLGVFIKKNVFVFLKMNYFFIIPSCIILKAYVSRKKLWGIYDLCLCFHSEKYDSIMCDNCSRNIYQFKYKLLYLALNETVNLLREYFACFKKNIFLRI